MTRTKAAKQRKKVGLVVSSQMKAPKSGVKQPAILNTTKDQRTQKLVNRQVSRPLAAAPGPGGTKDHAKLVVNARPAIPIPSTINGHSIPFLDDQWLLELRKAIGLLFMLTEFPPQPPQSPIPPSLAGKTLATSRTLTAAEEERLAGVFVYLASTSNDPRKVAALCLEESSDHSELTINLAANHGDLVPIKLHFEDIARLLRAAHNESLPDLSARLLEKVISMNRNRILCRLHSRHAKWSCSYKKSKIAKSPFLPQVVQLSRQKSTVIRSSSHSHAIDELEKHSISLETAEPVDATSTYGIGTIVDIVWIVHRLWTDEDFRELVPPGKVRSTLAKLSRYVSAAYFLIREAKRKSILATLKVEIVCYGPLPRTTYVPVSEDLDTTFFGLAPLVDTTQLSQRLSCQVTHPLANTRSILSNSYGDLVNAKCAVHAEMQLLFHYEIFNSRLPPRFIYSTKKPCYLCSLFFSIHGRLYEKWTFPQLIRDLRRPKVEAISGVLDRFSDAIVQAIQDAYTLSSKRPHVTNESFFLRSAIWPKASDLLQESSQTRHVPSTPSPRPSDRLQNVSAVESILPKISDIPATPHPVLPTIMMEEAMSCPDVSHVSSNKTVAATQTRVQSYQIDQGASVQLEISGPTKSARVKTKSVHFTFSNLINHARSVEEHANGPGRGYAAVEYLNAEQRLQPRHQLLSKTSVDIAALMPGHDMVLDQNVESSEIHGFYVSHGDDLFFVKCWNDDG